MNTEDVLKETQNISIGSGVWNLCGKVFLNIGKLKKHQQEDQAENVDIVLLALIMLLKHFLTLHAGNVINISGHLLCY